MDAERRGEGEERSSHAEVIREERGEALDVEEGEGGEERVGETSTRGGGDLITVSCIERLQEVVGCNSILSLSLMDTISYSCPSSCNNIKIMYNNCKQCLVQTIQTRKSNLWLCNCLFGDPYSCMQPF